MDNLKLLVIKLFFPAILFIAGLIVVIFGATGGQSGFFILGGIGLVVVGGLASLMMIGYDRIPLVVYKTLMITFIPAILLMFWFSFNSINDPIKFENEYRRRGELIKERLIHIRDAQEAFRSVNRRYTSDFDTLIDFIKFGEMPLLRRVNNTPAHLRDSLSDREAIKRGFILIDTTYIAVMDSIFKNVYNFNPDNLPWLPFSDPRQMFEMQSGFINRGNVTVPVFEVVADKKIFLADQRKQYVNQEKVISFQVGSMFEPIRDGNWE
jgi:hypothetical protein